MYRILLGFHDTKFQKKLGSALGSFGDEAEFIVSTKKASIERDILAEKPDVVILSDGTADGMWTFDEIAQIADSYNGQIIPIFSSSVIGDPQLQTLCTYGVTDALFADKSGKYNSSEIIRLIHQPRTQRAARSVYGIQSMRDVEGYTIDGLNDGIFEDILSKLYAAGGRLGLVYKEELSTLSPAVVVELNERLPEDITERLKTTREWYEIHGILKKAGAIKSYRIPKEIKKALKEDNNNNKKLERFKQVGANGSVVEAVRVESEEDDLDEADLYETEESPYQSAFKRTPVKPTEETEETKETSGAEDEKDDAKDVKEGKEDRAAGPKKEPKQRLSDFKATKAEEKEDNEETNVLKIVIIMVVSSAVFLILLLLLFLALSKKKETAQTPSSTGYDSQYGTEGERIELTGNGGAVMVDDTEETLNPVIVDNNEDLGGEVVMESEVEVNPSEGTEEIVFTGTSYQGVDLINRLNSSEGYDCTIQLTDGTRIDVYGGAASPEEIYPSGSFKEGKIGERFIYVQE